MDASAASRRSRGRSTRMASAPIRRRRRATALGLPQACVAGGNPRCWRPSRANASTTPSSPAIRCARWPRCTRPSAMMARLAPEPRQVRAEVSSATESGRAGHPRRSSAQRCAYLRNAVYPPSTEVTKPKRPSSTAALEQIGAQKPPDRMEAEVPEAGALAAVEHVFRAPAGVAVHLLDLVREVAVGHVPQGAREPARVGPGLESLVHAALDEAPVAGEQPGDPVLAPAAPGELATEVEVLPPDLIDLVRRSAQDRGQLLAQRVGHALVRVQGEDPLVPRLADGRVALRGDGRTGPLEHCRPRLARRGDGVVASIRRPPRCTSSAQARCRTHSPICAPSSSVGMTTVSGTGRPAIRPGCSCGTRRPGRRSAARSTS